VVCLDEEDVLSIHAHYELMSSVENQDLAVEGQVVNLDDLLTWWRRGGGMGGHPLTRILDLMEHRPTRRIAIGF